MRRRDVALALLLLAGTVLYLAAFPLHIPGGADEARQLYEARRVLDGERMYRDIFDFIMPGWIYLMALIFRLCGATLLAARTTAAVIHGATVALIFVACRQLGARRALASAAGIVHLVVCEPAYPVASQHWLVTSLSMLLLVICAGEVRAKARAFAAGVVVGLLIGVLQQRGALLALACVAFLVVDAALAARRPAALLGELIRFGAGATAVLVPLALWLLASAGFEPVWRAVVVYPLINYRSTFRGSWGHGGSSTRTIPRLIATLPIAMALPALRLLVLPLAGGAWARARGLALLTVFGACSLLSVAYYPDFIHIAFALPVFIITAAEGVEWALRLLPARAGAVVGWGLSLAIIGAGALRLEGNLASARAERTVRWRSAFGPVDVPRSSVDFFTRLDQLLRAAPGRELYVHPDPRYIYLLAGARNPTRFQFLFLGFHVQKEVDELIDDLAAHPPLYVVTMPIYVRPGDPVMRFIEQRYRPLSANRRTGRSIWKRIDPSPAAP